MRAVKAKRESSYSRQMTVTIYIYIYIYIYKNIYIHTMTEHLPTAITGVLTLVTVAGEVTTVALEVIQWYSHST